MQAILTKYRGPTDHKGSRVIASCEAKRIVVSWDHALDAVGNHIAAARQLGSQVFGGFERYDLVTGALPGGGYAHVLVPGLHALTAASRPKGPPMPRLNREGLTWAEWLAAAGNGPTATRAAWLAGDDPSEHRGA